MAGNLALESVPVTQEPHRNRDSKNSAALCFRHAKYTHVSQTLWRGLHYGSMKHCRKEDTLDHTARHVPSSVLNVRAWHPDLVEA